MNDAGSKMEREVLDLGGLKFSSRFRLFQSGNRSLNSSWFWRTIPIGKKKTWKQATAVGENIEESVYEAIRKSNKLESY